MALSSASCRTAEPPAPAPTAAASGQPSAELGPYSRATYLTAIERRAGGCYRVVEWQLPAGVPFSYVARDTVLRLDTIVSMQVNHGRGPLRLRPKPGGEGLDTGDGWGYGMGWPPDHLLLGWRAPPASEEDPERGVRELHGDFRVASDTLRGVLTRHQAGGQASASGRAIAVKASCR